MIPKTKLGFIGLASSELTILPKRLQMICLPFHRSLLLAAISTKQSSSSRLKSRNRNWKKSKKKKKNSSNNFKPCKRLTSRQRRNSSRKRKLNCTLWLSVSLINWQMMIILPPLRPLLIPRSLRYWLSKCKEAVLLLKNSEKSRNQNKKKKRKRKRRRSNKIKSRKSRLLFKRRRNRRERH